MKRNLLLLALLVACCAGSFAQNNVTLNINHKLGNEAFTFNEGAINSLGNEFEATRLEYYISEISIIHDGGTETAIEDYWILVDASETSSYDLGSYDINDVEALKLHVGVDPDHNHLDPASYASDHPLAPQFPSMHWGWSAGYRFVAYEGFGGPNYNQLFQLHGLEDPNYFETTIPLSASESNGEVSIDIDADYTQGLRDISLSSGVIIHGGYGAAKTCLENFRDYVFSEAGTVVGIEESTSVFEFDMYPNPANTGTAVSLTTPESSNTYSLTIFDLTGKMVASYDQLSGDQRFDFSLDNAGLYFVRLSDGENPDVTNKLTIR